MRPVKARFFLKSATVRSHAYILASPSVASRATSCVVLAEVGTSDHAPVMMTTT